ncbi:MAG: GTPase HflX, partial [Streptosporangiaceae bacterium]
EVLTEIGARDVPELVVFNKADCADELDLKGQQLAEPQSVAVSARTGDGLPLLLAEIERLLPKLSHQVDVVVPYSRGDLIARAHSEGEVLSIEHTDAGTQLAARVPPALAAELGRFVVAADLA